METELHTLRTLARRFRRYGLSTAWLKAEAEAGRIPCFKAGRRLLFDAAAVERTLIERAATADGVCHGAKLGRRCGGTA